MALFKREGIFFMFFSISVYYHGGDSNDATYAVVQVLCIPSHAKHCCRPSIWSMAVIMILLTLLSSET